MTCDQLSKLLTQLGAQRSGMKKSEMIVVIDAIDKRCVNWTAIKKQKDMSKVELIIHGNKIVFRVINVLFNVAFFGKFTSLNDNYDRQTHETYTTDMFFTEVSEAVNDNGSPIHASLLPCEDDKYKVQYDFYISEDRIPTEELPRGIMTNAADSKLCKQIYNDLVLIRKKMIGFMTQSGTHDGDVNPFEYVNQATKKAKVGFAYCPMAVYYFYMNCKFRPEVCESQRVSMNPILKDPKQSSQVSQKKKVITPNDNEYMKSFCSKMSDQLEEGHKVKKDELAERRQSRLSNEINSLRSLIVKEGEKKCRLFSEYRKASEDFIKNDIKDSIHECNRNIEKFQNIILDTETEDKENRKCIKLGLENDDYYTPLKRDNITIAIDENSDDDNDDSICIANKSEYHLAKKCDNDSGKKCDNDSDDDDDEI